MKEYMILLLCLLTTVYCIIRPEPIERNLKRRLVEGKYLQQDPHQGDHHGKKKEKGHTWALLVAGSNGWWNYRHQADVAHAYHTLIQHGFDESYIITLMYNDIAHNEQNPYPGKIFNQPHGEDVYNNVKIDYSSDDVNSENFLNILKGNQTAVVGGSGRVVESGPNDRIFVYFTDHGGTGVICFPNDVLSADSLNNVLDWMYSENLYDQLTFYLETCESGSMFDGILRTDIKVYAVTAANAWESSYGTYCDNDLNLPCLADLFSVSWMVDSDKKDLNTETLETQYEIVKVKTNMSHVQQFGDMGITKEPVAFFQGTKVTKSINTDMVTESDSSVSWPSRDVELRHLIQKRDRLQDVYERKALSKKIADIQEIRKSVKSLYHSVVGALLTETAERKAMFDLRRPITQRRCHHEVVHAFDQKCIDFNKFDYALKYVYVLNNLCEKIRDANKIIEAFTSTCPDAFFNL